jgi:hypothetical protein
VVEAGEGVEEVVFERACEQVRGLAAKVTEEAWLKAVCAALMGGMTGGIARAAAAAQALETLHDQGVVGVVAEVKAAVGSGAGVILGAVKELSAALALKSAREAELEKENARLLAMIGL